MLNQYLNTTTIFKKETLWALSFVLLSIIVSLIYLLSNGSVFTTVAIILLILIITLTFYRLTWGFYLFICLVLLFDQFPPRGYGITIIGVEYFLNLKSLNLFKNIEFAVINPLELHLILLILAWIFVFITRKNLYFQKIPNWLALILLFFWLSLSLIIGLSRGGDFLPALWELRALFYMGFMIIITPQIIQSKKDLINLIWFIIVTLTIKAFIGIIRLIRLGFDFGGRTELTNHEDPLFFISLMILLLSFILFKYKSSQKTFLYYIIPLIFIIFLFSQRRAAYAAFFMGTIAFLFLIQKEHLKTLLKFLIPFLIIFTIYTTIFWNSTGTIAIPAQLVKASITEPKNPSDLRFYSNLYRKVENYNLAQTVVKSPIIGIGFGKKYDQPIPLVHIPFPLQEYIPHNEIFWIMVKSGAIGFFFFFLFFNSYIFQISHLYKKIDDPYLKSICSMIIIATIGQLVVSFYDLQLTYYRNMIFLGTLLGLLPTIKTITALNNK